MTAKEFLRKELGEDLPDSLGNKVAELMEKYHRVRSEKRTVRYVGTNKRKTWCTYLSIYDVVGNIYEDGSLYIIDNDGDVTQLLDNEYEVVV